MTPRHALTLASLALLALLSASVTGEIMDLITAANAHVVGLGIAAGTVATCGFLVALNETIGRTAA